MKFKFDKLRAVYEKLSIFDFFLFAPGKEIVGYWSTLGCLLSLLMLVWLQKKRADRIAPTMLIALLIPLGLHVLIGLVQVAHRLYEVAFIGEFEHPNFRAHASIGVKNLSIVCTLCAEVGHQIAKTYVHHRALGLTTIALSMAMVGLLNFLEWSNQLFCVCCF